MFDGWTILSVTRYQQNCLGGELGHDILDEPRDALPAHKTAKSQQDDIIIGETEARKHLGSHSGELLCAYVRFRDAQPDHHHTVRGDAGTK